MTLTRKYLMLVDLLKTHYNAKITEIEGNILSISRLATTAALNAVENKTPNVSNLVKKISGIERLTIINLLVKHWMQR